jgi:GlpG protein
MNVPEPKPAQPQNFPRSKDGNWTSRIGPATAVLIGISVVVALISNLGSNDAFLKYLFADGSETTNGLPFADIIHGQIWRLITPIFIHFGIIHLLFNMMWLKDLGTLIEKRYSSRLLLTMVLILGLLSNVGQYIFAGPFFGGMSGVVYGLFGFVWMKSKFDPTSGFLVPTQTVIIMIGWLILCFTGALGPIGNAAHVIGLIVGATWGFVSAFKVREYVSRR